MVPAPEGEPAELAKRLDLGGRRAAGVLLLGPPRPEWVEAVAGPAPEKLVWPVPNGQIWRGVGPTGKRGRGRFHKGVDIGADEGTPIRAVAAGLVAYSDNGSRGYGNLMMIVHRDGSVAFYAHCRANYVFAGEQVAANQVIGEVGLTGISHGAHLHFELRVAGAAIDPLDRFEDAPPPPPWARRRHPGLARR
jgi:murein DD-endopeptidase MepM/ murein hydrolase activator NlpD